MIILKNSNFAIEIARQVMCSLFFIDQRKTYVGLANILLFEVTN